MRDSDGSTCLHQCVQNADDEYPDDTHLMFRRLLTDVGVSPDTLDAKDRRGRTALYWASLRCQTNAAKYLLRAGADVHVSSNDGETALHAACRENSPSFILTLIHSGADVNFCDDKQRTPLHHATANSKNSAFVISALLHKHNVDVNAQDDAGNTPLMYVIKEGVKCAVVLQIFLARQDCDVKIRNCQNQSALSLTSLDKCPVLFDAEKIHHQLTKTGDSNVVKS